MSQPDRQEGVAAWVRAREIERRSADARDRGARPVADLLAGEFVLREILDNEEACDAMEFLYAAGFTIIAPQRLAEAAMERERTATDV